MRKSNMLCFYERVFLFVFVFIFPSICIALEPNEILVIANSDIDASVKIARYYCNKRNVPIENILAIPLSSRLTDTISRADYQSKLAEPIRSKLTGVEFAGRIRCLVTTYGVPFKVGRRGMLKESKDKLSRLQNLLEREKRSLALLQQSNTTQSASQKKKIDRTIAQLQSAIRLVTGKETAASVDSELSMLLFDEYELYRWQPNWLNLKTGYWDFRTLMVSRLDGPGEKIAYELIDKAMIAEKNGLKGLCYVDWGHAANKRGNAKFAEYDKSLRQMASVVRQRTEMKVVEEKSEKVFAKNTCPRAAVYCGWYSLKNYVDAFDFVDGAIGYHIASWEAVDLRDPNSSQWCPAMLLDGITATLGAVAEPYLHAFPKPDEFFAELIEGSCLVEAYYRTKPFNSWQLILIGDPLYTPFKKPIIISQTK